MNPATAHTLFGLFAFVLGLVFGSFLNVCIARMPEDRSIVRPGSQCPACGHAVRARDNNTCTFPGCRNRRYLSCHHVEHWSNGGETSIDNLMLLCTKHHTLVHEGGFRIDKDYRDNWIFVRPDGIAVPDCGYHSHPPAGGLLSVAENTASEPQPPVYLH